VNLANAGALSGAAFSLIQYNSLLFFVHEESKEQFILSQFGMEHVYTLPWACGSLRVSVVLEASLSG
jgi:hypothetical protein